jgi:uncharacterized protein Yka (UPF0111/DUF47 family)
MLDSLIEASPYAATLILCMLLILKYGMPQFIAVMDKHADAAQAVAKQISMHNTLSKEVSEEIHRDILDIRQKAEEHSLQMQELISIQKMLAKNIEVPAAFMERQTKLFEIIAKNMGEKK